MFTDADIKNIAFCVNFTRRHADISGSEVTAIGALINAIDAEMAERVKAAAAAPAAKPDEPKE